MSTTVPVIPARIWATDQDTWKAWLASLKSKPHGVDPATVQKYKATITAFYSLLELPIAEVTEEHLQDYEAVLTEQFSANTVRARMKIIQAYWKFAQEHKA